jgi:hypothetical protein
LFLLDYYWFRTDFLERRSSKDLSSKAIRQQAVPELHFSSSWLRLA